MWNAIKNRLKAWLFGLEQAELDALRSKYAEAQTRLAELKIQAEEKFERLETEAQDAARFAQEQFQAGVLATRQKVADACTKVIENDTFNQSARTVATWVRGVANDVEELAEEALEKLIRKR